MLWLHRAVDILKMKKTPFYAKAEIQKEDREYFTDRKNEIKKYIRKLSSRTPTAIALIGERRIGKSSLILRVKEKLEKNCIPIIIYCEKIRPKKPVVFLKHIIELLLENLELKSKIIGKIKKIKTPSKIGFAYKDVSFWMGWEKIEDEMALFKKAEELINKINKKSKVVIFFDEFQEIFTFGESFLWAFRNLLQKTRASYLVTSSYYNFLKMIQDKKHPFFNFFMVEKLTGIPEAVIKKYLRRRIKIARMFFKDEIIDEIVHDSNRNPFYFQLLGDTCYDVALENGVKVINDNIYKRAYLNAIEQIPAHLTYECSKIYEMNGNMKNIFLAMCIYGVEKLSEITKKAKMDEKHVVTILKRLEDRFGLIKKISRGTYIVPNKFIKEWTKMKFT